MLPCAGTCCTAGLSSIPLVDFPMKLLEVAHRFLGNLYIYIYIINKYILSNAPASASCEEAITNNADRMLVRMSVQENCCIQAPSGDTATAAKALQCYKPQNDWLCVGCIFLLCVLGFVVFARRQLPPVCGHRRSLWNWRLPPCSCTCAEGAVDGRPDTFVTLRWGILLPPTHAWATQRPTTRIDLEKQ